MSCGSLNQDETGTAFFGWKMYDAGELSMMIVSPIGRPSCDKSCAVSHALYATTHLDVVAPVVVAALAEEPMADDVVNVEAVEHRIGVLGQRGGEDDDLVDLAHALEEIVHARPLDHVDVVRLVLDLDRHNEVGLVDHLQRDRQMASRRV